MLQCSPTTRPRRAASRAARSRARPLDNDDAESRQLEGVVPGRLVSPGVELRQGHSLGDGLDHFRRVQLPVRAKRDAGNSLLAGIDGDRGGRTPGAVDGEVAAPSETDCGDASRPIRPIDDGREKRFEELAGELIRGDCAIKFAAGWRRPLRSQSRSLSFERRDDHKIGVCYAWISNENIHRFGFLPFWHRAHYARLPFGFAGGRIRADMSRLTATTLCAAAILLVTDVSVPAQSGDKDEKKDPKRPSLSLKATPGTGMVPVRVSATAEFKGGDDDFQEYYCAARRMELGRRHSLGGRERLRAIRVAASHKSSAVSLSRTPTNAPARFASCSG